MKSYDKWKKELKKYQDGKSKYQWDELEELITDEFEDELLTSDEFNDIMKELMNLNCE